MLSSRPDWRFREVLTLGQGEDFWRVLGAVKARSNNNNSTFTGSLKVDSLDTPALPFSHPRDETRAEGAEPCQYTAQRTGPGGGSTRAASPYG